MNPNRKTARILEDVKINVKMKLSALWVTVMFCYLYADVKAFYLPGPCAYYYIFFGIVEIVLTALIVWYAWKWPKQEN